MWTSFTTWLAVTIVPVLGSLLKKILKNAGMLIFTDLMNEVYNKKAYQFVKELNARTDLTTTQKAVEFNKIFLEWLAISGKVISLSTLNLLRELAVSVIKSELKESK